MDAIVRHRQPQLWSPRRPAKPGRGYDDRNGADMMNTKTEIDLLDALSKVLLRCFVLGYALILLWVGVYFAAGAVIYGPANRMFGLTAHEVDLIQYCGIAFVKCLVLLFFLFPYIAIRLVLRKRACVPAVAFGELDPCLPTMPRT